MQSLHCHGFSSLKYLVYTSLIHSPFNMYKPNRDLLATFITYFIIIIP